MRMLLTFAVLVVCGCTSHFVIDVSTGDRYGFKTWPWTSESGEWCADLEARAAYYGWGARTQYPTNVYHRIKIVMYDEGSDVSQTNVLKRARYWIRGEKR
jgi:hypothetical protein